MNEPTEILQAFQRGEMTLAECWERLKVVRKPKPHDEPELLTPPSKVYEPLNEAELKMISEFDSVSFGASNSMKRFARQVRGKKELTARQREYLRLLVWKYRRQIFGKKNADPRAKAYIETMKVTL
jgi:hypothetical protein